MFFWWWKTYIHGKNLQVEGRNIFVILPWPLSLKVTYPKGHLPRIYGQLTLSFKCEHGDGTSEKCSLEGRESPASLTLQRFYVVTTAVCSRGLMGSHVGSPRD